MAMAVDGDWATKSEAIQIAQQEIKQWADDCESNPKMAGCGSGGGFTGAIADLYGPSGLKAVVNDCFGNFRVGHCVVAGAMVAPVGKGIRGGKLAIRLVKGKKSASNAANAARLAAQLTREEAASVFTESGGLKASVIKHSARIASASGTKIGNPAVIADLKEVGGLISDWGKYTTQRFKSPAGSFQVHFYYNPTTGQAYYGRDYKAIFTGRPR
jgi:hypothetical protein